MFSINRQAILGSATKAPVLASGANFSPGSSGFNIGGTVIQSDFNFSILDGFIDINNKDVMYRTFREIYMLDAVTGPAIDQLSSLPWSSYGIIGVEDPRILQTYGDCLSELNLVRLMTYLSTCYLVLGVAVGSLVFDKTRGIFSDCILYNPDSCEITPIPMAGYDPKVDLKVSKEMQKFLASKDERDIEAMKEIPLELQQQLRGGTIPLEPLTTIILNRSALPGIQTLSYLSRILPIWLVEKALTRGTLIASTRRQRSVLHVTCLTGDTLIDKDGGLVRLDSIVPHKRGELSPGTAVDVDFSTIGFNGKRVNVNKWIYQGKKPVYEITTKSGYKIKATANHKFVTLCDESVRYTFKRLDELQKGDFLAISDKNDEKISQYKLNIDKDKLYSDSPYEWNSSRISIPSHMTPELAYFIGMLLSDGCILDKRVIISGISRKHLEYLNSIIENIFGISGIVFKRYSKGTKVKLPDRYTTNTKSLYNLHINSVAFIRFLQQIGLHTGIELKKFIRGHKLSYRINKGSNYAKPSHVKHIPYSILEADRKTQIAFLAGYIDGDGTVQLTSSKQYNKFRLLITSTSILMLQNIQILLAHLGLKAHVSYNRVTIVFSSYNLPKLYKELLEFLFLKRKRVDIDKFNVNINGDSCGIPIPSIINEIDSHYVGRVPGSKQYIFRNDENEDVVVNYWGNVAYGLFICRPTKFMLYKHYEQGVYKEVLDKIKEISYSFKNRLERHLNNAVLYDEIVSIRKIGVKDVYDISIDTSEGDKPVFVANGIMVHNCGSDEWEPTDEQYQSIANLFANSDRDPQGSIVVTRPDINVSEIRSPTDFWGISNERDVFTQMKLRALGLNDSWGTDSNYSVQENSMTMFLENMNNFRNNLTRNVLYDKVFLLLAKYHSFRRRTKVELQHHVRYDSSSHHAARNEEMYKRAVITGSRNLAEAATYVIPELKWTKELEPRGNSTVLGILQTAKDLGMPLPISLISTYAGVPITTLLDSLKQDIEHRKQIKKYNDEVAKLTPKEDEGGGGMFGSVHGKDNIKLHKLTSRVQRAKDIASIKDSGMLKTYLYKNMAPDVSMNPTQAKQIINFANSIKPGTISI